MKLVKRLEKNYSFWFLLGISFIFFILRWPSLFEPYWYGDEGIYHAVGMLINSGHSLYSEAWDNKPPLLYIIYALFNSDQFLIRGISLLFGLFSVWTFYFLARKLFEKSIKAVFISTTFFAFVFGTWIIEGNIANAENFMLFPILASAYLLLFPSTFRKIKPRIIFLTAGIILSLAFLTKIVAIFDLLAFIFFLVLISEKNIHKQFHTKILPLISGFLIPVVLCTFYFFITNNFMPFLEAFIFSNINYVGHFNDLLIPRGLLYLKIIILCSYLLFIYKKRELFSKVNIFILIWIGFSLFNSFFSQRPYTHYLLVLLPSFSLLVGLIISKTKHRFLNLFLLISVFILVYSNFKLYEKIIPYYSNLLEFCSDKKDVDSYQSFFDDITPMDYKIASYIRANSKDSDSVFIWGNNAQVYKLSDRIPLFRYTVAYHILGYETGVKEMETAINKKQPKIIVVMPNVPKYPLTLLKYERKIDIMGAIIYEKIL